MKRLKQIIALLLIIIMILGVLPLGVLAKEIKQLGNEEIIENLDGISQDYAYPTGYFGTYPQKKVEDENLILILNCQTPDENNIVYINGSKYLEYEGGYYQFLPLRWKVIEEDGGTYTLLCDTVIGNCSYLDGANHEQVCWKNSYIRKYLNSKIYNRMFTDEMKNDVLTNQVRDLGSLSPFVTEDKMYILSAHEIRKYFGYENLDLRLVKLKPYDMPDFGYDQENLVASYWTRDYMSSGWRNFFTDSASAMSSDDYEVELPDYGPDSYQPALDGMYARFVNEEGKFDNKMTSHGSGIRPVIRINKNSKYWSWTEPNPEYIPKEKTTWETGYYGTYPQERIMDEKLLDTLRTIKRDEYNTLEYEGEKYYESSNMYFKFTPLKWRVLKDEGDDYLLMTDTLVDCASYYTEGVPHLDWSTSAIRKILNNEFYNRAFSSDQKNEIIVSTVDDHESDGPITQDKVFILSAGEFYNQYGFLSNNSRKMKAVDFVPYIDEEGNAPYYTRTCSLRVCNDGTFRGAISSWGYGLAPVIRIPKNSPNWSQNFPSESVKITDIKFSSTSINLAIGVTKKLTATITPNNATNKTLTWMSSNKRVATVDVNGNVKGVNAGTTIITATAKDGSGKKGICKVTVSSSKNTKVTKVDIIKNTLSLTVGKSSKLTTKITPSNATNKALSWTSSNKKVATVDSKGTIKGIKPGTVTITATAKDGSGKKDTCKVTVKASNVKVTGVKLSSTKASLEVGKTVKLKATILPANATNKVVTWKSSNTSVATVINGTVTAKKAGTAIITVTTKDGSKKATCKVTVKVKNIKVSNVELNITSVTVNKGKTVKLSAIVNPTNATNKVVIWKSSNTSVATVSNGTVTGKKAGTAIITVTTKDGSKKATCKVAVK